MEFAGESLDDVLIRLYRALLDTGSSNRGSRGDTVELLGTALRITKPRTRISRSENRGKPFSAIGELLWYLSGSAELEFIKPYVPAYEDDATDGVIHGAYGPRLLAMRGNINQFDNIHDLLTKKSTSRRAVIQLFNAEDIAGDFKEVPCTTTLQFHLRNGLLHLSATLRSNDAYLGLPHDVFCFTMLQEMMARRLNVELGEYLHYAGSMHVYEPDRPDVEQYISEGFQKSVEMPAMPPGNPFNLVPALLEFEADTRNAATINASDRFTEPYWADIARMVQIYWATTAGRINALKKEMSDDIYRTYLDRRRVRKR